MKIETRKKWQSAALRSGIFTLLVLPLRALFSYMNDEMEMVFQPQFYIFGLILFLVMLPIYYFTATHNPTWGDVFIFFKRKKQ